MSTYGSLDGVASLVAHATENGSFSVATTPSATTVTTWLDQRSAQLDAWLALNGYSPGITTPQAVKTVLDYYANHGAAGSVELSMRSAGYDANDQNRRENKFIAEFEKAQAFIRDGGLAALGAVTAGASSALTGFAVGGRTTGGQRLQPIFTRNMFDSDPTVENGTTEPDYTTR